MSIPLGKVCSKCGAFKAPSEYHASKQNVDGFFPYCRDCRKEYDRIRHVEKAEQYRAYDRAYREANHDQVLVRGRAYAAKHREQRKVYSRERYRLNPDQVKAENRAWRKRNLAWGRAKSKRWAEQNPEKWKEMIQQWKDANPDRVRANKRNYRARRHMADGRFTEQEWIALCERYQNKCLACGEQKPLTADHVVPLTKGGTNYISNIQPLCAECNSIKHTRIIDYRPNDAL